MILEAIYTRLGEPAWYWPAVMSIVFIGLPLAASALEAM